MYLRGQNTAVFCEFSIWSTSYMHLYRREVVLYIMFYYAISTVDSFDRYGVL